MQTEQPAAGARGARGDGGRGGRAPGRQKGPPAIVKAGAGTSHLRTTPSLALRSLLLTQAGPVR